MALIQSTAIPSGATDYELEQGLKFEDGNEPKLTFTPSTAGNRKKITVSVWAKRGKLGASNSIISSGGRFDTAVVFDSNDKIQVFTNYAESYRGIQTSAVFRDTSAWYHIVATWDTNNSTSTDRHIVWVNGVRQAVGSETTMPQNGSTELMNTTEHTIGTGGRYQNQNQLDGYLAEMHVIDGQVLTPADFGETGTYGEWKPIEYSGTYGTNGFYLPFKNDYTVEGFSTVTYRGNGGTQYIGGTGFQPDMLWVKERTSTSSHQIHDAIRGAGKALFTNSTSAESSSSTYVSSFNTDGFNVGSSGSVNSSSDTYVAWNWDMGGSNATNTDGSITSTVRANTTYGQSIVSYTGTGSDATVGHGLSTQVDFVIVKTRSHGGDWMVYYGDATDFLKLNETNATEDLKAVWNDWEGGTSTSTFSLGNNGDVNTNGRTYIAYCFHSVTGYSKFGTYTGTGSSTGPSVTTGFRPAFVMVKITSDAGGWEIWDNTRNPNNPLTNTLQANLSNAELTSGRDIDFTDTGFQIKNTTSNSNGSGQTYIYMAFADKREYAYWLDQSGNNNDWTSNNLTESDISVDSPTNNFATLNPLDMDDSITVSEGNLKAIQSGVQHDAIRSTMANSTGKWYFEVRVADVEQYIMLGLLDTTIEVGSNTYQKTGSWYFVTDGSTFHDGTEANTGLSATAAGDIVQVAYDLDAGKIWWGVNNTWLLSGNPSTGANPAFSDLSGTLAPAGSIYQAANGAIWNFGQDSSFAGNKTAQGNQDGNDIGDFYYTPPTGFLALCTKNLPDVAVVPSEHFNTVLYTGTDADNRAITGVGFQPDFVWFKRRNTSTDHGLFDVLRGANKRLESNNTDVEFTDSNSLMSFDSDGYTVSSDGTTNAAGTYVAWNWKANGSGSSNTDGSINTTATSANVDAGFSISTYTGTGVNGTIGHGLSKAPEMVIVKERGDDTGHWYVWHTGFAATKGFYLNETSALATSDTYWNDTAPTSSVFSVGTNTDINGTTGTDTYVAYCFHSVDGYSKVGSYTGNGNADGTFVYTGFRPKYVLIKSVNDQSWNITDTARINYNLNDLRLLANSSGAEEDRGDSDGIDMLSNGFKLRSTATIINSANNFIYIAFAETPFKYSNAR